AGSEVRAEAVQTLSFVRNGFEERATLNREAGKLEISSGLNQTLTLQIGRLPSAMLAADLNGDGLTDLVVVKEGSGNVAVLLGREDGWASPLYFGTEEGPVSVAVGDFDEDGKTDLAVLNLASESVSLLSQEAFVPVPFGFLDMPSTGSQVAGAT